jgi:hypothetical protein
MFRWNNELQEQYYTKNPGSPESLVDFGQVPEDLQDREDWEAEVSRFIRSLAGRGYLFQAAMYDGNSGASPLYSVRLDRGDFNGPRPVDLQYFEWVVRQLCLPGQTTHIRERVLGIQVLPEEDLGSLLAGNR